MKWSLQACHTNTLTIHSRLRTLKANLASTFFNTNRTPSYALQHTTRTQPLFNAKMQASIRTLGLVALAMLLIATMTYGTYSEMRARPAARFGRALLEEVKPAVGKNEQHEKSDTTRTTTRTAEEASNTKSETVEVPNAEKEEDEAASHSDDEVEEVEGDKLPFFLRQAANADAEDDYSDYEVEESRVGVEEAPKLDTAERAAGGDEDLYYDEEDAYDDDADEAAKEL